MDVEIFTLSLLEKLDLICHLPYEREHIVPYVEENTGEFKFLNIQMKETIRSTV